MLNAAERRAAAELLPFLADPQSTVSQAFASQASLIRLPAQATVFAEGDQCSAFAILAQGQVRVFKIGETGREITLYRFARGESCILTVSCILSTHRFPAIATVEAAAEAFVVPNTSFKQWVDAFPVWREYVFALLSQRLATVMAIIDEVAFQRVDVRIAALLLRTAATVDQPVTMTHQQIAAEIGTSREVVSRILADFAATGLVQLGRGSIIIQDYAGLTRRADGR
ncbi:MAG: Crp/Fnr family transcriptional regulator [Oscillochloridaceae bacterium umkhey_bin13]